MSRCHRSRLSAAALLGAAVLAFPALGPAFAQEAGRVLTLDLTQRLEGQRNRSLTPGGDLAETISTTALGFSLDSITGLDRLSLSASTLLRGSFGDRAEDFAFSEPVLKFGYSRTGARADFSLSASTASSDISYLNPFELVLNDDGTVEIVSDFDSLSGTGTRRRSVVSAEANWGKEARLGFGAALSLAAIDYQDVTSPDLVDNQTLDASLSARYAITPILSLGTTLSYGRTEQDGSAARETRGYGLSLTATGGTGQVAADLDVTRAPGGDHRYALSGLWAEDLASGGQVSVRLGTVWTVTGDAALTARTTYVQPTPSGRLGAQFERGVEDNVDGEEVLNTTGLVSYDHTINRVSRIGMEFSYAEAENLTLGTDLRQTELSASYGRQLAQKWTAEIGAARTWRDDNGASASSDSLYLEIGRAFTSPF